MKVATNLISYKLLPSKFEAHFCRMYRRFLAFFKTIKITADQWYFFISVIELVFENLKSCALEIRFSKHAKFKNENPSPITQMTLCTKFQNLIFLCKNVMFFESCHKLDILQILTFEIRSLFLSYLPTFLAIFQNHQNHCRPVKLLH